MPVLPRRRHETGQLYAFQKTLDTYQDALGADSTLTLTTDSDLFRLRKQVQPAPPPAR